MAKNTVLSTAGNTIVLFTGLLLMCVGYTMAQHTPPGKVKEEAQKHQVVVAKLTRYDIKQEYQEQFRKALGDYVAGALVNENNIMAEAYAEEAQPGVMWVIERWNSKMSLDKFDKTSSFKAVIALSKNALLQPTQTIYVKDLEPISKKQWRTAASPADTPLTIMLFVDAKPGTEHNFQVIYHSVMPHFRSEPGVINYQLSQFEDDHTRFVTYEQFRSEAAFQYHLKYPPIQPVIDYLNSSIKKQPFQTGLHRLVPFPPR